MTSIGTFTHAEDKTYHYSGLITVREPGTYHIELYPSSGEVKKGIPKKFDVRGEKVE